MTCHSLVRVITVLVSIRVSSICSKSKQCFYLLWLSPPSLSNLHFLSFLSLAHTHTRTHSPTLYLVHSRSLAVYASHPILSFSIYLLLPLSPHCLNISDSFLVSQCQAHRWKHKSFRPIIRGNHLVHSQREELLRINTKPSSDSLCESVSILLHFTSILVTDCSQLSNLYRTNWQRSNLHFLFSLSWQSINHK